MSRARCALFFPFFSTSTSTSAPKTTEPSKQKELKEIDRDKASGVTVTLKGGSLKKLTGYVEGGNILVLGRERGKSKAGSREAKNSPCPSSSRQPKHYCSRTGPKDTPYEEGFFVVDIELGEVWRRRLYFSFLRLPSGKVRRRKTFKKPLTSFFPPFFFTNKHFLADDQYPFVPPKMKFVTKVWHPNISSASGAICLDILKDAWSPALTLKTALLSLQALLASPEPGDPQDAVVARQYLSEHATWEQTARAWTQNYATREAATAASEAKVAKLTEMGFSAAAATRALTESGGDEQAALEMLLSATGT